MSKIPTSFKLFSSTYNVEYDDTFVNSHNAYGMFEDSLKVIKLAKTNNAFNLPIDQIRETYYHELAHCLAKQTGNKIWKDEVFVELLGKLLMQYVDTVQYGTEGK